MGKGIEEIGSVDEETPSKPVHCVGCLKRFTSPEQAELHKMYHKREKTFRYVYTHHDCDLPAYLGGPGHRRKRR